MRYGRPFRCVPILNSSHRPFTLSSVAKKQKEVRTKTNLVKSTTGSGWHFLIFDQKVADPFGFEDKFRRVLCSINGGEKFHCALMPDGSDLYIIVNKKRRDELGIVAGDTVDVVLVKDESQYGLPMPEEFRAVLDQDPDGDRLFHDLGKGQQRSVLYLLSRPKDVDVRIHQSLIVVQHLKDNGGKVIGDKLYRQLKRPPFDL
jgi:hypothetical protein